MRHEEGGASGGSDSGSGGDGSGGDSSAGGDNGSGGTASGGSDALGGQGGMGGSGIARFETVEVRVWVIPRRRVCDLLPGDFTTDLGTHEFVLTNGPGTRRDVPIPTVPPQYARPRGGWNDDSSAGSLTGGALAIPGSDDSDFGQTVGACELWPFLDQLPVGTTVCEARVEYLPFDG